MRRFARARRSKRVRALVRREVPHLEEDRYFHPDIAAATNSSREGAVIDAAGAATLPSLERIRAMTDGHPDWLVVERREAPLIVSIPHAGTDLLDFEAGFRRSVARAQGCGLAARRALRFRRPLGATLVRTKLSRSIIDVNRDPSGASLYPGQATTELVPTTTFDGEPLYREGQAPDAARNRRAAASLFRSLSCGARG